jgi:hypothetical protein
MMVAKNWNKIHLYNKTNSLKWTGTAQAIYNSKNVNTIISAYNV